MDSTRVVENPSCSGCGADLPEIRIDVDMPNVYSCIDCQEEQMKKAPNTWVVYARPALEESE
jgi:RNA polymerase-binding transcription factor DksA